MDKICPAFDASTHRGTGQFVVKQRDDGSPYEEEIIEPIPQAVIVRRFADAIQTHIDSKARERSYDSALSAISYIGCVNPQWSAEGEAVRDWRGNVWLAAYAILAEVTADPPTRPMPTVDELIAELPALNWPT